MRGPVPLLIAIMTFVMVVVAAAGLALANTASVVQGGCRESLFDPDRRRRGEGPGGDCRGTDSARRHPGRAGRAGGSAPDARTLAWPGRRARPICRCRRSSMSTSGPAPIPPAVAQAIEQAVPGARFVAHRASLAPLLKALRGADAARARAGPADRAGERRGGRAGGARRARHPSRARSRSCTASARPIDQVARLFLRQIAIDALIGRSRRRRGRGPGHRPDPRRRRAPRRMLAGSAAARAGTMLLLLRLLPFAIAAARNAGCQGALLQGIARALMIARLLAFLAILYALGFALFAVTLGTPAAAGYAEGRRDRRDHRRQGPDRTWRRACSPTARASGC